MGLDPNIHVFDGIYNTKGRSPLHVLVANYTNKHVTCNKGQCIGHKEPSIDHMPQNSVNSITTQKMIDEHVPPGTFTPPLYNLPDNERKSLNQLLETFKSQYAQDGTSIGTTHLAKIQIDTGDSESVSQRSCPITMQHYDWAKNEIKLLNAQVIYSSHPSWSPPIIVVSKGDSGKCLVIDYKVTWKLSVALAKG